MLSTYKKTPSGFAELEQRSTGLRPELRRLLILIDGRRVVASLAALFRAGELEPLIDELASFGMIELVTHSTTFMPAEAVNAAGRVSLDGAQLQTAIDAAKVGVRELLGRESKDFLAKLDRCADSQALRQIVSEVQLRLIATKSEDAATDFVTSIRNANRPN
jgi:hypothetical protein